ncbi:MAG: 2-C-methyl-D-erythritol 4-phosphate cytidylyltransferase [Melioribacter sp.]|uniref:2-C-methyl-D-erythritol 4-phosphate cytidylyltransferase n=1 Tax=Rosettibacter primus TaxID=3111523 RepID=UPI00247CAAFD|nr:2-C-methyl-D-erythritol 4-phosphate cytidylyltransferase [Melioribacter sp.]
MKTFAIIPAGGKGLRINSEIPKQFLSINDKEIIAYTIDVFQKCNLVDEIIIASQKDYFELLNHIKLRYSFTKITKIVEGGRERQFSVFNAVKSIIANDDDLIIVHDAVRPLLPLSVLENAIKTATQYGSSIVAIKAKDTLVKGNEFVEDYIDRKEIYYVQTPQVFQYKIFYESMKKAEKDKFIGTDESMILKNAGYKVKIVEGSAFNFKITTKDDLKLFSLISQSNERY